MPVSDRASNAQESARRQALKFGLDPGSLTGADFEALHARACVYCGQTPSRGANHIVPLSVGGANALENLEPCCLPCNKKLPGKAWRIPSKLTPAQVREIRSSDSSQSALSSVFGVSQPTISRIKSGFRRAALWGGAS